MVWAGGTQSILRARRPCLPWSAGRSASPLDGMNGVYIVTAHCISTSNDAEPTSNGAYVNVYTTDSSESQAKATAMKALASAGWRCLDITGVARRTRQDYVGNADGLEYFEQALLDGIVLVAHTFPRESEL